MERKEPTFTASSSTPSSAPSAARPDVIQPEQSSASSRVREQPVRPQATPNRVELREDVTAARGNSPVGVIALILSIVGLCAGGYLVWQLTEAQAALKLADTRIQGLEQQLNMTSEESTASVVTLQANLKKFEANLQKITQQVEANRTGLAASNGKITASERNITQLTKDRDTLVAGIADVKKSVAAQNSTIDSAVAKVDTAGTAIAKQQQQQQGLSEELAKLRMEMVDSEALNVRLKTVEEGIKSMDSYRLTTNREILQIKQQLSAPK